MRNEIDIKEKSREAIRNISGLNEEFQGMKLQFHRDGTPVSSYETSAHTSKNHPAFRNLSLLTLLLLFFSAGWNENVVWGQNYTGTTQIIATGNRDTVHTRTEIIYVDPSKPRVLSLPELKINDGTDESYRWYVHWYGSKGTIKGETIYINETEAEDRGGSIISGGGWYASDLHVAEDGLWWYDGFYGTGKNDQNQWAHLASCASTIAYTPEGDLSEDDELTCDVSNYQNYTENSDTQFTEPTLLKRYRYILRSASKCADVLKERPLEDYNIDYPKESAGTVNLSMLSLPENYFWYENGESGELISGETFIYGFVEDYSAESYSNFEQLQVQQIRGLSGNEPQIVYVRAINGGEVSPVLAKYTFNPKSDTNFILEENTIPDSRTPEKYTDLYEEIGVVDFDQNDAEPTLSKENNMATNPMPQDETVYGFMFKDVQSVRIRLTPGQNQYGLYRSANVEGISKNSVVISGKDYRWIPPLMNSTMYGSNTLYDRTYERTKNSSDKKYGFFYYIDASDDPGTLVDVPIKGTLCGYTELVVTAWLADMTRPGRSDQGNLPLAPNVNLILKGRDPNTDEEVVLHFFTSGDAITHYDSSENNIHLMKWQQLCYRIVLPAGIDQYTDFHLEVQNNEPHTDGADYAIDDVRIYKSKPNIKVQRENECDASTLLISTDFPTILRNMGWTAGEPAVQVTEEEAAKNVDYRKYRYGLMGESHEHDANSYAGNVYFAFLSEDLETWQTVNKKVEDYPFAAKSLRVAASTELNKTDFEFYVEMDETLDPEKAMAKAKADAIMNERIMNYRAVLDYNQDVEAGLWEKEGINRNNTIVVSEDAINPESGNFNEEAYETALVELFGKRLGIPRIRCPWYDKENNRLYLAIIDVNNTDLKYQGQIESQDADPASGNYWVVTFSAEQVAGFGDVEGFTINPKDDCTLKSPFTVLPATTVLIDAISPSNPDIAVCQGTLHTLEAYLNFFDKETGEAIDNDKVDVDYIFDWYLGPEAGNYDVEKIKAALEAYRDENGGLDADVVPGAIEEWAKGVNQEYGTLLIELIEKDLLLLGIPANEPFDLVVDAERIVAMPYVPDVEAGETTYAFCSDITEVNLGVVTDIVPNMYQGFFNVTYPSEAEVALRLGQRHIAQTLDLPIYKVNNMASNATRLGLAGESVDIYLEVEESVEPTKIGEASGLSISLGENEEGTLEVTEQGFLTFTLDEDAKNILHEGQRYTLLIPFAQYAEDERLDSACDGLLRLPVKIVPEYLTWKGSTEEDWYNDDLWNQSTRGELHFDGTSTDDANGSDEIANAYSPLYFTRITILGDSVPDNSELRLSPITYEDNVGTLNIENIIRYDMAVDTLLNDDESKSLDIIPYYINKVDQIYFKPGATLLNQHLLNYHKAWVEFEMTPGKDYWMASPLKDVYAGDMYAPTIGGQQHTPAFESITYDEDKNDRWDPAFYQKAWDGDIQYASSDTDNDGIPDENEIKSVKAVSSNWSIEYNDATVPYSIGKGFYSRVEKSDATTVMVRLPKADTKYKYEYSPSTSTRALDEVEEKASQPNMADLEEDGSYVLDLDSVDNDGNHFLVGNPYMAYLQMDGDDGFLTVNSAVIANKYWTVDGETIVVGTPDVDWSSGSTTGYIAPLQAFFVERKGYEPTKTTKAETDTEEKLEVSFNVSMTVPAPKKEEADTRSYEATNPQLTLTASSAKGKSRAAVVQSFDASNQYESDRDAVTLLDSELDAPTVYTVAGNYAAAVNAVHDYANVPLGVYAKDNEEVELTIEGASQLVEPIYLYDAVTRSSTPIEDDSYTLSLTGSSHGRYFLTTDAGNIRVESDIRIYSPNGGQLIIAASPSDKLKQVQIYDLSGRMVESRKNIGASTCQLNVTKGIYIVRVISEQGSAEAKLRIR